MSDDTTRCPVTDLLTRDCAHCEDQHTRANATYVLTVGLRKRAANQARTIHTPDCWHALADTEPPLPTRITLKPQAAPDASEPHTASDEFIDLESRREEWLATGRFRRKHVTRRELQPGPNSTVIHNGQTYKRCKVCSPAIQ